MKVTVTQVDGKNAIIHVNLSHSMSLVLSIREPNPSEDGTSEAQFKRVVHARVRETGPRGGWKGEPRTIGWAKLDVRDGSLVGLQGEPLNG